VVYECSAFILIKRPLTIPLIDM